MIGTTNRERIPLDGGLPRVIVYVKNASCRMRKEFRQAIKALAIAVNRDVDGKMIPEQLLDGRTMIAPVWRQVSRVSDRKVMYVKAPYVTVLTVPDGLAVYDVAGTPESLGELIKLPCIAEYHYPVPGGGGQTLTAQGQTKKPGSHSHQKHK